MLNSPKIGEKTPYFKLEGILEGKVSLWDLQNLKEKWVVLFFYPGDFSQLSGQELLDLESQKNILHELNSLVLACSIDSVDVHRAWLEKLGNISFPLLTDIHHIAALDYNVYDEVKAQSMRGTFIIDPQGILRWYQVSDFKLNRDVPEIAKILRQLQESL